MKTKKELIEFIYGSDIAPSIEKRIDQLQEQWSELINVPKIPRGKLPLTSDDVVMISYGDSIRKEGMSPLQALKEFADLWLKDMLSGIHILPFSPYTSDDGFSVVDYRQINPDLGSWDDIEDLGEKFNLMFDLVLNHCSASSDWFKGFMAGDKKYKNYFHSVDPSTDLSSVFRPRALPLLSEFETHKGTEYIWTTFSPDQVDLDFSNPDVLLEFLDIFLLYAAKGAQIIRLDAIGFLWKEIGTSCMHHPKTHAVVQLYRAVLNEVAPHVILLTETNVPHKENISYFGDGRDEAHMVYQFTLPPLTLDAFARESAVHLTDWASSLPDVNSDHTYFNFMSSHDGIGVLPARGYLSDDELDNLISVVKSRGGKVSYKATPDGEIPYELNINYRDAVNHPDLPVDLKAMQFLSSQAVMLCMAGVPGIYVHSILGSGNWTKGVEESGINRRINREKLDSLTLVRELEEEDSLRNLIYRGYKDLLKIRRSHKAFDPSSPQSVLKLDPEVFALIRTAYDGSESILCLQNTSRRRLHMTLDGRNCPVALPAECSSLTDGGSVIEASEGRWGIILEPYEVCWAAF
ncbi:MULTISPECIES: sugar phosphorylase [unclassified Oceanispirochaeta]|uniref:sugar phosphorylase n=1 Tax=unclassified Oceanispirochaeta TaxID=2635722 RepID=UPI000E099B66|nr:MULTISPECIES: sugar phosphorylase [unclassified Oceanispirochaeta]MBF9014727.1 sugar phosphorylase [Oceanispirochaeta sp. M2]NPD70983.1 sugar phosphorylase [Oceanispirochaeta sp. M1]RDG33816.1 alpha-amylase [Oceanispirochaeta sp. M1]